MLLKLALIIALSMNALAAVGVQSAAQNLLSERPKPFPESHIMLKSADFRFLPYDLPVYEVGEKQSSHYYYTPALRLIFGGDGPNAEVTRNYLSESGESCATEDGCAINRVQLFLQRVNQREIVDAIRKHTKNKKAKSDPLSGKYWLTTREKYGESVLKTAIMSVGAWSTDSPVPVSFVVGSWEEAKDFIENLERRNDVLHLHYVFSGESTNFCQATYTSEAKSAIVVHENRNSDAEWVSLKRTSDIAEEASKSTHVELTCGDDPVSTARLQEMVKSHLAVEARRGGQWVSWTEAKEMLSRVDADDFSTNVIGSESLTVDEVERRRAGNESISAGGKIEGCHGKMCLGLEGEYTGDDVKSGRIYLENGVMYSRDQNLYVPQEIGVYRRDAVRGAIDTLATYNLGYKDVEEGEGMVTLGRQAWVREDAESPLYSSYESILDHRTEIKVCFLELDEVGTKYVNLGHEEFDAAWAQRQRNSDSAMIHRDKENGRWMLLTGSGSQAIVHFARGAQVARSTRIWSRDIGGDSTSVSCP